MNFDIADLLRDPQLNGSLGKYRADKSKKTIQADTDDEAIAAFLSEHHRKPATYRTYDKELNRLLLWALLYLKKPISSMDRDDFLKYVEFIKKPDPAWCSTAGKLRREHPNWRPFMGPLAESGQRVAVAAINAMMDWLTKSRYIVSNPMGLILDPIDKDNQFAKVTRYLDDDMWASVKDAIETLPRETTLDIYRYERYKFMISVFILLCSRISEVCNIKMGHFRLTPYGWFWFVNGKGSKYSNVAMPPDMVTALMRWREFLGLSPVPKTTEPFPAIPFADRTGRPNLDMDGISTRRVHNVLKELFELASGHLKQNGQPDKADLILQASAHWLRHTSITQKLNAGIPRDLVQQEARHTDVRTTNTYIHDEEKKRVKESEKHLY